MKRSTLFFLTLLSAGALTSCSTPDYDPSVSPARPYVPRVTMPVELNDHEQNLIGEVEDSLERSGLRPTDRSGAEYQLGFSVEDGPVNADVTLDLYQGRNRIAHAYARVGGPRIVFQRQRIIREAFGKALRQFEAQLPRQNSGWGGEHYGPGSHPSGDRPRYGDSIPPGPGGQPPYPYQQPGQADYPYSPPGGGAPDWQSGY